MQMQIKRSNYVFLNYDSFIDCHALSFIHKNKLSEQISNKLTILKGFLTADDESILLENLRCSDLYSEDEKERFFYF